jgi:hypothetical protein
MLKDPGERSAAFTEAIGKPGFTGFFAVRQEIVKWDMNAENSPDTVRLIRSS